MSLAEQWQPLLNQYDDYRRFRASRKKERDARWDMSKGWRSLAKKPKMTKQMSSLGNVYEVPDNDIEEFMTFYNTMEGNELSPQYEAGAGRLKNVQTPADYIDYAFGKNSKAKIIEQEGVGHIKYLWYAKRYQLLKVKFWNDTIVVFFRVPETLVSTLVALAQNGGTRKGNDGKQRHLLGIYFWDLVRIRGTLHGSRYKYHYVQDNNSGGLVGRPFGSGKYFYETETGPNKNIATAKKAVEDFKNEAIENKHLLEAMKKGQDIDQAARDTIDTLIDGLDNSIKLADDRLSEIGDVPDVTRTFKTERITKPRQIGNPANVPITGDLDALEGLDPEQRSMVNRATTGKDAEYDMQQKAISRHNALRRIDRTWDVDRLDDYVETLANEGKLGGTVDQFYGKFTNAGDQFDFLKSRGLIPPNAIFK